MKNILKIMIFFSIFTPVVMFGKQVSVDAATVYLNKTSMTMNYKQSYRLQLKNNTKKVSWTSGDKSIATVSSKGTVTTKSTSGTVTITAKTGGEYYECTLKVQSGKLSDAQITLKKGSTYTIRKSVVYSAKWSSSNKSIATVSSSGKVTAKKAGTCYISAKIGSKTSKCKVTVKNGYSKVTIKPTTKPYNGKYTNTDAYKKDAKTRIMYTIRSYMSKFEIEGGGTLVLSKGSYGLKAGVFVPSNVTIQLANGTTVYKAGKVGSANYKVSIFSIIPPSIVTATEAEYAAYTASHGTESKTYQFPSAAKAYEGSQNVVIKGAKGGKSVIDHKGKFYTFGIATGHANGLRIQDIKFKNMDGNHFIELNSSKNVVIQRCSFTDDLSSFDYNSKTGLYYYNDQIAEGKSAPTVANKEAINIDTCDPNIQGFNNPWAYHDYTPCDSITIKDCTFTRIVRPIGSHKYTATQNSETGKWDQQVYNTNIKILNNTFKSTGCNAIAMCNWDKVTITGNTIKTVNNVIANPYKNATHKNQNFFRSINPSKVVDGVKVVDTNSSLKQQAAIVIFGGGASINISNNKIDDAIVGVAAFNLNNLVGGRKYATSRYQISAANIKKIKEQNTYTKISSKCKWFFADESDFAVNGVSPSVSGKREYLPSEYNVDWTAILQSYYKKYFATKIQSQADTENSDEVVSTEVEEATTEEATETTMEELTTETIMEEVTTKETTTAMQKEE